MSWLYFLQNVEIGNEIVTSMFSSFEKNRNSHYILLEPLSTAHETAEQ